MPRTNDGFEKLNGIFKNLIDHDVIVITIVRNFALGDFQPAMNRFIGLEPARPQPSLQFGKRRWQDEHGNGLRDPGLHLSRTLDVDVQYDVTALRKLLLHK